MKYFTIFDMDRINFPLILLVISKFENRSEVFILKYIICDFYKILSYLYAQAYFFRIIDKRILSETDTRNHSLK